MKAFPLPLGEGQGEGRALRVDMHRHPSPLPGGEGVRRLARRLTITPGNAAMTGLTLFVTFVVLYPLGTLLYGSLLSAGPGRAAGLTLANYVSAYTDPQTYALFATTAILAGGKTLLATTFAVS